MKTAIAVGLAKSLEGVLQAPRTWTGPFPLCVAPPDQLGSATPRSLHRSGARRQLARPGLNQTAKYQSSFQPPNLCRTQTPFPFILCALLFLIPEEKICDRAKNRHDKNAESGGGPEWGRWHNLVDRPVAYVVDESGDDQLVWRSGGVTESFDVVLHGRGRVADRHCRYFVDTEAEPVLPLVPE